MGCHSGYNVHDGHALPGRRLDYPQALARKSAWWIGNTGYGYGVDDAISFTERVLHLYTRYLTSGPGVSVGQALVQAKRHYLGEAASGGFGTYDEKILIEPTLYGLPMYQVTVPSPGPWSAGGLAGGLAGGERSTATDVGAQGDAASSVHVETKTLSIDYDPVHDTPNGQFYTIDGLALFSPGRPIQPRTSVSLDPVQGSIPHGALLLGGQSTIDTDYNPVIARPVPTSTAALAEPAFAIPAWFPQKLFAINRMGGTDRLVIVPAQFKGNQDVGVQRRFTQMRFAVTYSESDDRMPPVIWRVESERAGAGVLLSVAAGDASGVERVLVTYANPVGSSNSDTWQSYDLTYNTYTERWEGTLSGLTGKAIFILQAMDAAGNVTISSNKGQYFSPEPNHIYLPITVRKALSR